ncbi:MAG: hypothetical protein ACRD2W_07155 [Acidimicrobiales bacterium]
MSDFGDLGDFSADFTGDLQPKSDAPPSAAGFDEAVPVAEDFIEAVVWGEHNKVWDLIGTTGRSEVLEVATKRGMDEGLAARLAVDNGSPSETREFLADLVNGLRSELAGNDLDSITYEVDEDRSEAGRAAVKMFVPLHKLLGGTLPIGTLYLVPENDTWRVERLIPLTSK